MVDREPAIFHAAACPAEARSAKAGTGSRGQACPVSGHLRGAREWEFLFSRTALAQVMRADAETVRGRDLAAGFPLVELHLRFADRCQLLVGAVAHGDLLARDEEHLADRQVMRAGDPFARLQDVAKLRLVRVPVG